MMSTKKMESMPLLSGYKVPPTDRCVCGGGGCALHVEGHTLTYSHADTFILFSHRFMLTYIILFVHGIGHLLPWNMFITAHQVSGCWDSSSTAHHVC